MTSKDIKVGARFGRWKVLEINTINPNSKAKNPPKMALCECQCKNKTIRYKEYRDLYSGRSLSCGCLRNEQTAIRNKNNSSVKIGNRYGYLEVIEDLGYRQQSRGKNESWYRCLCHHCGNEKFEVNGNNLQSGNTTSCGCIKSYGEEIIIKLLIDNNIPFEREKQFNNCILPGGGRAKFDFYVNNQYIIEFDGKQHFEQNNFFGQSLNQIQLYDRIKNQWCFDNDIPIIRIPYTHLKDLCIEDLQLETTTFLID